MREIRAQSLGQEDPLEKEMAILSSILAWKIPWTGRGSLVGYSPRGRKELDTTGMLLTYYSVIKRKKKKSCHLKQYGWT